MNARWVEVPIPNPYVLRVNNLGACRCGRCYKWIDDGDECWEGPTWLCLKCGPKKPAPQVRGVATPADRGQNVGADRAMLSATNDQQRFPTLRRWFNRLFAAGERPEK